LAPAAASSLTSKPEGGSAGGAEVRCFARCDGLASHPFPSNWTPLGRAQRVTCSAENSEVIADLVHRSRPTQRASRKAPWLGIACTRPAYRCVSHDAAGGGAREQRQDPAGCSAIRGWRSCTNTDLCQQLTASARRPTRAPRSRKSWPRCGRSRSGWRRW
jgi:hypothetical protein